MNINGFGGPPAHAAAHNRHTTATSPQKTADETVEKSESDTASTGPDTADAVSKGRSADAPAHVVRALLAENAASASKEGTDSTAAPNFFGKLVSALARGENPLELLAASTAQKNDEDETQETEEPSTPIIENDVVV